jgi:hypothetical protein
MAAWCEAPRAAGEPVSAGALLDQMRAHLPDGCVLAQLPEPAGRVRLRTIDSAMLAAAVAAVAQWAAREAGDGALVVSSRQAPDDAEGFTLEMRPAAPPASGGENDRPATPMRFDGGGLGLALVLASYVLDAHGARVMAAGSGIVAVRLQKDRGSA